MKPGEYMLGHPVMVKGVPVELNDIDINRHFKTALLDFVEMCEAIVEGFTRNALYM